jgi:hypothetical protein
MIKKKDSSMQKKLFIAMFITGFLFSAQAHFMSSIWPQKSLSSHEYGNPSASKRVLIGGVASSFKNALLKNVIDSLMKDSVYVKVVGLKDLAKEPATQWSVVLILNTCMAWEIENTVKNYMNSFPLYNSFIVVTTSGNPKTCGSAAKLPKNIDAISTASKTVKLPEVLARVLELLRKKLGR